MLGLSLLVFKNIVKAEDIDYKKVQKGVEEFGQWCENMKEEVEGLNADERADKIRRDIFEYFEKYNDDELLAMEQEFVKRDSEYNKFGRESIRAVLLEERWEEKPPVLKLLNEVVINPEIDDKIRKGWLSTISRKVKGKPSEDELKKKVLSSAIKIYKDKTNEIILRAEAIESIAEMEGRNEEVIRIILSALDNPDESEEVKVKAIWGINSSLKKIDEKTIQKLLYILDNHQKYTPDIVCATLHTLGRTKDKRAIKSIIKIMETTQDEDIFGVAVARLQFFNDPLLIDAIFENAARFKYFKRDPVYYYNEELLLEYLKEGEGKYFSEAITTFNRYFTAKGIPVLLKMSKHSDKEIRKAAIKALELTGRDKNIAEKNADEIIKGLIKLSKQEKNEEIASLMKKAIDNIRYSQQAREDKTKKRN